MFPSINIAGYVTIHFFWVFALLGIITGMYILLKLIQKFRMNLSVLTKHGMMIAIASIIGARILRAIFTWNDYVDRGKLLTDLIYYPFDIEYSAWGGLIGAAIVFIPYLYKKKEDIQKWLDISVIAFLGGFAVGNIGLFMNGARHFGTPTSLPWGVIIETSKYTVPIHPTQIYTALYSGILAYALYRLSRSNYSSFWKQSGNIALLGASIFCSLRFFEEFIIGDSKYLTIAGIYITYYITLTVAVGSIVVLSKRYKAFKNS